MLRRGLCLGADVPQRLPRARSAAAVERELVVFFAAVPDGKELGAFQFLK